MRHAIAGLGLLALSACVGTDQGLYDPHLYDANGNVVTATAAPPPPPPLPAAAGPECRETQRTVIIGGQPRTAVATACRQQDGSWRFVN